MSRIKVMGGCLAVMLASSMVAAAAAEALPEWQKEGKSLTETLSFKVHGLTGQFEGGGIGVTWKSVGGKGVIKGANEVAKLSLIFWGSKVKISKEECEVNSPGAAKGEVVSKELKGSLGYLNKASKIVGALAQPAAGTTVAEIEGACFEGKEDVIGSVVGEVTSELNKETSSATLSFAVTSGGKQEFTKFEGESGEHTLGFTGSVFVGAALFECKEEKFELEGGKKVEIKA
jgi:hypothetical protein